MFIVTLLLILSTGPLFFCLRAVCQKVLARQFPPEFSRSIVNTIRLEFPSVLKAIEDSGSPGEFSRLKENLQCDFLALTYLLKNAANLHRRFSYEDRLLILYFRLLFAALVARHGLKLRETPAALELTAILQYFANVIGERVYKVKFESLPASDCLPPLYLSTSPLGIPGHATTPRRKDS
jgi:hypothetical protein